MQIKNCEFYHPDGQNSTSFPGFTIKSNYIGILSGVNGSGKTCFLKFLKQNPNLFIPDRTGKDIIILDQFYEHLLFPYKPVWWNISLPKILQNSLDIDSAKEVAKKYLSYFSITLNLDRYPEHLSGGEKHIVLLSRFALTDQNTLLLDEPFTAIDVNNRQTVWNIIKDLAINHTKDILLTTHDVFEEGDIVNEITFDAIGGSTIKLGQFKFK